MFAKQPLKAVEKNNPPLLLREQNAGKKKELDDLVFETLRRVIDSMDEKVELDKLDSFQKRQFTEQIYDTLVTLLEEKNIILSQGDKQRVIQNVLDEIFGFGPINALLGDPAVTEIMVNGWDSVYVEKDGRIIKTDITFRDNEHVLHVINKIITPLGRRIDESSPTVDARLPDGSRLNAVIPPLALRGPSLTIRKFSAEPFTAEDLIQKGTLTREMALFLKACVRARLNIIVTGGTGSGKTTTLNVLSSFIPEKERIVTIEDTAELQLCQEHVVTLESRPANIEGRGQFTIRELVINSLRMRPDRIIVGEVRGGEALDMLQAMNTGHDGSISTLHANSPRDALSRLETMVLMAGMELPLKAVREQIASAIELIIHQSRFGDGSRKITRISEVVGIKNGSISLQDIFIFQQSGSDEQGNVLGEHLFTGVSPRCLKKLRASIEWAEIESIFPQWSREKEAPGEAQPPSGDENDEEGESAGDDGSSPVGKKEAQKEKEIPLLSSRKEDPSREGEHFSEAANQHPKSGLPLRIPPGLRGIAIPVKRAAALSGYLSVGNRVDVLIIYEGKDGSTPPSVSTAVRGALVLETGELTAGTEEHKAEQTVLLAVTPEEAEALACGCLRGIFYLLLCPGT